jgi:hypothetical protein
MNNKHADVKKLQQIEYQAKFPIGTVYAETRQRAGSLRVGPSGTEGEEFYFREVKQNENDSGSH